MYKLLIVDDNKMQIKSLLFYIEKCPELKISKIITAINGADGLRKFSEFRPDIVISDVVMPEMDGIEMAGRIKLLNPSVKFIFISCYENFDYLKSAMDTEAVSYLLKPFDEQDIKNALTKVTNAIEYEREHLRMTNLLAESIDTYRKNFLYRLLYSQTIDPDLIRQAVANLNFDIYSSFMFVKLEISGGSGRFIDIYNILNLTESDLATDFPPVMVAENESKIVILLMSKLNPQEFLDNTISALKSYNRHIKEMLGVELSMGLSLIYPSLESAHIMLSQASCALEMKTSGETGGINIYSNREQFPLVTDMVNYINKNYREIKSVASLAAHFYISESYARKIFKRHTGTTIYDAILTKRMEDAKMLLQDPNMRIYQVASIVGYKGKAHFINAFKKYTGQLPRDYQSELLRKEQSDV